MNTGKKIGLFVSFFNCPPNDFYWWSIVPEVLPSHIKRLFKKKKWSTIALHWVKCKFCAGCRCTMKWIRSTCTPFLVDLPPTSSSLPRGHHGEMGSLGYAALPTSYLVYHASVCMSALSSQVVCRAPSPTVTTGLFSMPVYLDFLKTSRNC